ncbi:MAG: SDR family oxidoreductase [Candidatus Binataceae bacterium]
MAEGGLDLVTGAFSYTGKYIARELLSQGRRIRTLTGHPNRHSPPGEEIEAIPFNFDDPEKLAESFRGCERVFNTYWIRFARGKLDFERAIANSRALINAARDAGVRRFIHVSITNCSADSPLPYFRGKGIIERYLRDSGISHAIVRPTVVFGREDVLLNNIAWLLRRCPVFAIPGSGDYRLQPIFVEDLAAIAIEAAAETSNIAIDATGPETYTFNALISLICTIIQRRPKIVHAPPYLTLAFAKIIGMSVGDVMLTADELRGLMAELLISERPPPGVIRLSQWLSHHAHTIGAAPASEIERHYR